MAYDVFISHASQDKVPADCVCAGLEAAKIRCWVAPRDILPGQDWGEAIVKGIEAAQIMVLVLSARANQSPHVKREVERAVNKGMVIIPLRIDEVVPSASLEYFLSTTHWLDAVTPPLEAHIHRLAETIQAILRTYQPDSKTKGKISTVLWVNDKPTQGEQEIGNLRQRGIKVVRAASTTEAMRLLVKGDVTADAVISDMGRYEEGEYRCHAGILFIELVRKARFKMPVVIYGSATYQAKNHRMAVEAGGTGAITSEAELLTLLGLDQ